jgi:hypothetical protein
MEVNIYCSKCNSINSNLKLRCSNCGNLIESINHWYKRSGSINLIFFGLIIIIINYFLLNIFSGLETVYYSSFYFGLLGLFLIIVGANIYRKNINYINEYKKVFVILEKNQIARSFVSIISSIIIIEIVFLYLLNIELSSNIFDFFANIFYQSYTYGFIWGYLAAAILIPFNIFLKKESVKIADTILKHFILGILTIIIFVEIAKAETGNLFDQWFTFLIGAIKGIIG